jgi:hypothetical protein
VSLYGCVVCGENVPRYGAKCARCDEGPLNQVAPDRVVLTDDDREMCPVCSEYPVTEGIYCRRCAQSIVEDRLERGSGR